MLRVLSGTTLSSKMNLEPSSSLQMHRNLGYLPLALEAGGVGRHSGIPAVALQPAREGQGVAFTTQIWFIAVKAMLLQWGNQSTVHLRCAFDNPFR